MTAWRFGLLGLATVVSLAAAPSGPRSFMITPGQQLFVIQPTHATIGTVRPGSHFTPAPTPNREAEAPLPPRASMDATVNPTLFTRKEQYRGDGFSPNSTAQDAEERHYTPGAGFNVKMPIQ